MLPSVGYGALSDYQRVSPGHYTVAMRAPGASEKSAPILSTNLEVASGEAYTVAGVDRYANISLKVLKDDLSPPDPGKARMRVVQASSVAPVVDVTTTTGQTIAENVSFPSTTDYAEVPAQQWTLEATPQSTGVKPAEEAVQLDAGSIYTVLVLDKGKKAVQLDTHTDAAGSATTPVGSVDTGLGGMAPADGSRLAQGALPVAVLAALLSPVWPGRGGAPGFEDLRPRRLRVGRRLLAAVLRGAGSARRASEHVGVADDARRHGRAGAA
jgi:hypothetical protein